MNIISLNRCITIDSL